MCPADRHDVSTCYRHRHSPLILCLHAAQPFLTSSAPNLSNLTIVLAALPPLDVFTRATNPSLEPDSLPLCFKLKDHNVLDIPIFVFDGLVIRSHVA